MIWRRDNTAKYLYLGMIISFWVGEGRIDGFMKGWIYLWEWTEKLHMMDKYKALYLCIKKLKKKESEGEQWVSSCC